MKAAARTRRTRQSAEERDRDLPCFQKFSDPLFFTTKKISDSLSLLPKNSIPKNQRSSLFYFQKNQRSSLIYFQKEIAAPEISDHLFFTSKKSAILSHFPSKKRHPLFFYLKKTASQKSMILSIFTSKNNNILSLFTSKKNSGGYNNLGSSLFYFQKSIIPQNQRSYLFLLPKNNILSLFTSKKTAVGMVKLLVKKKQGFWVETFSIY